MPQFSIRTLLELIAIVAVVLAVVYERWSVERPTARYVVVPEGGNRGYILLLDTQTGECWERAINGAGNGVWFPHAAPIPKK